jgi:hypothetical protein
MGDFIFLLYHYFILPEFSFKDKTTVIQNPLQELYRNFHL